MALLYRFSKQGGDRHHCLVRIEVTCAVRIRTHRASGVSVAPVVAAGDVLFVSVRTRPKALLATAPGNPGGGGGVVGVPLLGQPGVCGHGLALAAAASPPPALAVRTDDVPPVLGQAAGDGRPLVDPATAVDAARAAQPHLLAACVGEVRRLLALVEGWVPPGLDEVVLRVRQGLLSSGVVCQGEGRKDSYRSGGRLLGRTEELGLSMLTFVIQCSLAK